MDNKVGDKLPTPKQIAKALEAIREARKVLEPFVISLSSEERKRLVRFRPGGEMVVDKVAALASERNVSIPGISVQAMQADLELARALAPIANELEKLTAEVDDTVQEAEAECWWAATAFYSTLARTQAADRKLEAELKPVVDFFAIGRRKKKGEEPPK
jgi:hypothetical protein